MASKKRKDKKARAETTTAAAPAKAEEKPAAPAAGAPASAAGSAPKPGIVVPPPHAPKVDPKFHAKPAHGQDAFVETAQTSLEKLRENWQVIAAGLLVLAVGTLFLMWRAESGRARNRLAWEQLRQAQAGEERGSPPAPDHLKGLLEQYRGTTAEPFLELALADAHYRAGGRDGLARAAEIYDRVLRDFGENPLAASTARRSKEAVARSLGFDPKKAAETRGEKVEWAKTEPQAATSGASPSR